MEDTTEKARYLLPVLLNTSFMKLVEYSPHNRKIECSSPVADTDTWSQCYKMLSVAKKPFMLNVIMMNFVLMNVVVSLKNFE